MKKQNQVGALLNQAYKCIPRHERSTQGVSPDVLELLDAIFADDITVGQAVRALFETADLPLLQQAAKNSGQKIDFNAYVLKAERAGTIRLALLAWKALRRKQRVWRKPKREPRVTRRPGAWGGKL